MVNILRIEYQAIHSRKDAAASPTALVILTHPLATIEKNKKTFRVVWHAHICLPAKQSTQLESEWRHGTLLLGILPLRYDARIKRKINENKGFAVSWVAK